MKLSFSTWLLVLIPHLVNSFTDESHFSAVFNELRHFRVFTPQEYDPVNRDKRFPVIYYFHGCGGSYQRSGTYSYADYELVAPEAHGKDYHPDYAFPNNAEFENFVSENEVIIISVDGHIDGLPGCGVYFPSQLDSWNGNYYDFSTYIRELISVVDSRYHTIADPQNRAVSGLSMGGHMALWVAATNPDLFASISEFCYSPAYYDVGAPEYQTTVDLMQLWRNFRGVKVRHTTTDRDYLRYYTDQLAASFEGAGFENEYHLADYCKHHAADIDLQFDFHLKTFATKKISPDCFSYINLYPAFQVWGYEVSTKKSGNGWTYLHNVSLNGLGIYTRKRLPFGKSLPEFDISITTPGYYKPNTKYKLSRYSYRDQTISRQEITSDSTGKLTIASKGGMGEEIGIIGDKLQPPVFILTDTINENIYLDPNQVTPLSFELVNLSDSVQTVDFFVSTENKNLLSVLDQPKSITISAQTKVYIDTLVLVKGSVSGNSRQIGYIKINASVNGQKQLREHIFRAEVRGDLYKGAARIQIFDGRSAELMLFKYAWNEWGDPISSEMVSEGAGNGNGKPEIGEVFSIWIQPSEAFDRLDQGTWHPMIPVNGSSNPDVTVEEIIQHRYNTGRAVLSAQIRLNRSPTKTNPVKIPLQTEFLKVEYLEDDCHRNTADNFEYAYYDLIVREDGTVRLTLQTE